MHSTLEGSVPPYIGVDLTDRYAPGCRRIDVCGLTPDSKGLLIPKFWKWHWDPAPGTLDIRSIENELRQCMYTMVDGPQGLARPQRRLRECERCCGAVGKTQYLRPRSLRMFGGFICSSLDLFDALHRAGLALSAADFKGVNEIYPGHSWAKFATRLPKKTKTEGRVARKAILETCGVVFQSGFLPNADENDAAIGALLAAAADRKVTGLGIRHVGDPLYLDKNVLREGPIVVPNLEHDLLRRIQDAVEKFKGPAPLRLTPIKRTPAIRQSAQLRTILPPTVLLQILIESANEGRPVLLTYGEAYRILCDPEMKVYGQGYGDKVIHIATRTAPQTLENLGEVRLDTFIVDKKTKKPSTGHWPEVNYDEEDWIRLFNDAEIDPEEL
ncbi:MAG TPA: hypothetical protein VEK08_10745 [Planctomycetota bacterium]|nr:hypothetical protein [Planctomycetota bacterium]